MNSSSIFETTEFLVESPESYTKKHYVQIITPSLELKACDFIMELVTGKIIIQAKKDHNDKIKFSFTDTLSLLTENEMDSTKIYNLKLKLSEKISEDSLKRKKYAVINYFPKTRTKKCSCKKLVCICCYCSAYRRQNKRTLQKIEMILSDEAMKEIQNEIKKRNANQMVPLTHTLSTNRKYIFFINNNYNNANNALMNQIISTAHMEIQYYNTSEISNIISELNINECNGILFVDQNIVVHQIINEIMKRKDSSHFLDKIPLGAIPIQNKANGLFKTVAEESYEEVNGESAIFIVAKGKYKEFDLIQVSGERNENDNIIKEDIYSMIYVSWCKNGSIDSQLINKVNHCCKSISKKIKYWCSCLCNKGYDVTFKYYKSKALKINDISRSTISLDHTKSVNPSFFSIGSISESGSGKRDEGSVKGVDDDKKNKTIEEPITYFICSNLPYIYHNMHIAPKSRPDDGGCSIILMRKSKGGCLDLLKQLSETQYNGDYFDTEGNLKRALNINYYSASTWNLEMKEKINLPFYIDGKEYFFDKIEAKVLSQKVKVFCLN